MTTYLQRTFPVGESVLQFIPNQYQSFAERVLEVAFDGTATVLPVNTNCQMIRSIITMFN